MSKGQNKLHIIGIEKVNFLKIYYQVGRKVIRLKNKLKNHE